MARRTGDKLTHKSDEALKLVYMLSETVMTYCLLPYYMQIQVQESTRDVKRLWINSIPFDQIGWPWSKKTCVANPAPVHCTLRMNECYYVNWHELLSN